MFLSTFKWTFATDSLIIKLYILFTRKNSNQFLAKTAKGCQRLESRRRILTLTFPFTTISCQFLFRHTHTPPTSLFSLIFCRKKNNIVTVCNKRTGCHQSELLLQRSLPPTDQVPLGRPSFMAIKWAKKRRKPNALNRSLDKFIQHISCDQHINIIILYLCENTRMSIYKPAGVCGWGSFGSGWYKYHTELGIGLKMKRKM